VDANTANAMPKREWIARVLGIQLHGGENAQVAPSPDRAGWTNEEQAAIMQAATTWANACGQIEGDAKSVEAFVATAYEPEYAAEVQAGFRRRLKQLVAELDAGLSDVLAGLARESAPERRQAVLLDAQKQLGERQEFVEQDEMVAALADNPFVIVDTRKSLGKALGTIAQALARVQPGERGAP
jgi:hypothetical protein